MNDINKDTGPNRPLHEDITPPDYQHNFDKKNICKKCRSEGWTKGSLCTGTK